MAKTLNKEAIPEVYNIYLYRGDDASFTITLDGDEAALVTPGEAEAEAWIQVMSGNADPDAEIHIPFTCNIIDQGVIELFLPASRTRDAVPGYVFPWDFQITNDVGFTKTYLRGQAVFIEDVTK